MTTRAHVRTVVTEWGVAELFGKSMRERAMALIGIAHPDVRDACGRGALAQARLIRPFVGRDPVRDERSRTLRSRGTRC